jgi:hypothetical protein|tara:strand:- start:2755 stop:2898 length:144 start_codon:yes stop_codon:yes gene_type:complete
VNLIVDRVKKALGTIAAVVTDRAKEVFSITAASNWPSAGKFLKKELL